MMKKKLPGLESEIVNIRFFVIMTLFISLLSCSGPSGPENFTLPELPPEPQPRGYVCYRTVSPVIPDGVINEKSWNDVPWTDYFVDIEGSAKPDPELKTRAKLLWDDTNLYVAAYLEEPHIWATLRQRDTVVFFDNDFEIFIDPDGDTHAYYEIEVNAFGTEWDLLLLKPYRDGGPVVNGWDIAGMKVGTHIDGTINDPGDTDKGWSVEFTIPLTALKECNKGGRMPKPGDQWRIGFSRVEWRTLVENGRYKKEINPATGRPFPEDNWVWSPQGRINMHMPEMWGYLQFSSIEAGSGTEAFIPDKAHDVKWALRKIYYAESEYFKENKTYSSKLSDIGLTMKDFPESFPSPVIQTTRTTFESYFPFPDHDAVWRIYNDGRIMDMNRSLTTR